MLRLRLDPPNAILADENAHDRWGLAKQAGNSKREKDEEEESESRKRGKEMSESIEERQDRLEEVITHLFEATKGIVLLGLNTDINLGTLAQKVKALEKEACLLPPPSQN